MAAVLCVTAKLGNRCPLCSLAAANADSGRVRFTPESCRIGKASPNSLTCRWNTWSARSSLIPATPSRYRSTGRTFLRRWTSGMCSAPSSRLPSRLLQSPSMPRRSLELRHFDTQDGRSRFRRNSEGGIPSHQKRPLSTGRLGTASVLVAKFGKGIPCFLQKPRPSYTAVFVSLARSLEWQWWSALPSRPQSQRSLPIRTRLSSSSREFPPC
jgi:hypothetical protein